MRRVIVFSALMLSVVSCGQIKKSTEDNDPWRLHFNKGKDLRSRSELKLAEAEFLEALQYARLERPPGLRSALTVNALGVIYLSQNRVNDSKPLLCEARSIFESREETENVHFVSVLFNVGEMELRLQNGLEAEAAYRRALLILSRLQGGEPSSMAAEALKGVVASLCVQGRNEEAKELGSPLQLECQ